MVKRWTTIEPVSPSSFSSILDFGGRVFARDREQRCFVHSRVLKRQHEWQQKGSKGSDPFWLLLSMAQCVKNTPAIQETQETWVPSLGWDDALEEEMATHSNILTWKTPWTEELGGLQSMGLQRVKQNWAYTHIHIHTYVCVILVFIPISGTELLKLFGISYKVVTAIYMSCAMLMKSLLESPQVT